LLDIRGEGFNINVKAGETVFVPANSGEYEPDGKATVLLTLNP